MLKTNKRGRKKVDDKWYLRARLVEMLLIDWDRNESFDFDDVRKNVFRASLSLNFTLSKVLQSLPSVRIQSLFHS